MTLFLLYLGELIALRDQLKTGLSGGEQKKGEPTVADVAARIKMLRAANQVGAAPQRAGKVALAETPVTARIRKKAEADDTWEQRVADREGRQPDFH